MNFTECVSCSCHDIRSNTDTFSWSKVSFQSFVGRSVAGNFLCSFGVDCVVLYLWWLEGHVLCGSRISGFDCSNLGFESVAVNKYDGGEVKRNPERLRCSSD